MISLENKITRTCVLQQVLLTSSAAPPPALIIPFVKSESSSVIQISTRFDCLVLAVGEFTGSGLMIREQGLGAELRNGDFAIFRLEETTYFNLGYLGKRASLVLHTDGRFETWEKDHNGWKDHLYFKYL